jgi:hypothetical protein
MVCVHLLIGVSAHLCMSIYAYTVFIKKIIFTTLCGYLCHLLEICEPCEFRILIAWVANELENNMKFTPSGFKLNQETSSLWHMFRTGGTSCFELKMVRIYSMFSCIDGVSILYYCCKISA